jgi:hypothetical protein
MRASSVSRKGSVARTVAAVVTLAAISCGAQDRASLPLATTSSATPAESDAAVSQGCLGAPTQILSLRDAKNVPFSLAYFRGCGWRYRPIRQPMDEHLSQSGKNLVSETTLMSAALPPDEPLTVFVDGPTGYTFVWIRDAGWKFVGQLAGNAL